MTPNSTIICCICIKNCVVYRKLNDRDSNHMEFREKLHSFFPSEAWKETYLICMDCIEKLNNAYDFLKSCLKSEEYRKFSSETATSRQNIVQAESYSNAAKSSVNNPQKSSFVCDICNKPFKLKKYLDSHLKRMHIPIKEFIKSESSSSSDNFTVEDFDYSKTDNTLSKNGVDSYCRVEDNFVDCIKAREACNSNCRLIDAKMDIKNETKEEIEINHTAKEPTVKKDRFRQQKNPKSFESCCNIVFTSMNKYTSHLKIEHKSVQPFCCDECDAKYISKQSLIIHKRKHNSERPYMCSKCGKGFVSSNDLWQHDKTHDVIPTYSCDKCEKSFKTHSNLRTHKHQMHLDKALWKYVCTVCGKKFPLGSNLVKHMRRHEGVKPFSCNLCQKRFVEKGDLQVHLVSHSNERLFKCHLCVKEYKKRETLRRHLKVEHGIGNIKIKKPEKILPCPKCPKVFAFNNKLQRHILTHTGERPVGCDLCNKRFRDNYDRNMHLKKEHNLQPSL